jgi:hypothetical protein
MVFYILIFDVISKEEWRPFPVSNVSVAAVDVYYSM